MSNNRTFQQWVRQRRAELDLTQHALAEQVGCAAQTIRTFESGRRRPSREMAELLAERLQVPTGERAEFVKLARAQPSVSTKHDPSASPAVGAAEGGARRATATQATTEQTPLLVSKLYVPRPRTDLISRSRLLTRLEIGQAKALTLIAAPAGWGKTSLLADWLSQSVRERRIAWLALDSGDGTLSVFLRYLIAALQTIAPEFGAATTVLLRSTQAPVIETVMALLANDLASLPDPSTIVIDDYHVIDSTEIHQGMAFLLDHLPAQLHIVIATRSDPPLPLARLRTRGQLTEIRAKDLRFTPEETATFLRGSVGVTVSVDEIVALEARTEGWIAGLQLAALALRDAADDQRTQFIEAFTGSHRFVLDYLVDEVLARQPSRIQTFLLQTSILERLSGSLCDAIVLPEEALLSADSRGLLEDLERANLFIVPLDDARNWYRYHHLFAQVLRERLYRTSGGVESDRVVQLHQRASSWFEENGLTVEGLQHAYAGRDWAHAVRMLIAHGRVLLVNGQAQMVLNWLDTLPTSCMHEHPYLMHLRALALFYVNQFTAAEIQLERVEALLSTNTSDARAQSIRGYAMLLRCTISRFRGDASAAIKQGTQAMELMPPNDVARHATANVLIASAMLLSGDASATNERRLISVLETARSVGDTSTLLNGLIFLATLRRRQSRLREAAATFDEIIQLVPEDSKRQALGNGASYFFGKGDLLREWNDLASAEQHLTLGRSIALEASTAGEADSIVSGFIGLARLLVTRHEYDRAVATLRELADLARERVFHTDLIASIRAAQAYMTYLQGDLQGAIRWADSSTVDLRSEFQPAREQVYLIWARVRIAQGRRDPQGRMLQDVLDLLARLETDAEAGSRTESAITLMSLRTLVHQAQGNLSAALIVLERALTLAEPAGYVRLFVDEGQNMATLLAYALEPDSSGTEHRLQGDVRVYANKLMSVFKEEGIDPQSRAQGTKPNSDMLTERELQVLQLLASGYGTDAIARELIVATGTVKRHINNILRKLDVQSRLEAVVKARSLNLV